MITHKIRAEWARCHFVSLLGKEFEVKSIAAENGDFGDLDGFEFNSEIYGGFLYFWSSAILEYHLVNYKTGMEVIPITVKGIETEDSTEEILRPFMNELVSITKEQ